MDVAEQLVVMNEGRVEQIGPPQEIYHSPSSVFVANFIGVANLIPAIVQDTTGGATTVVLAGSHRVPVPQGVTRVRPGASATVMVRPERLRLSQADGGEGGGVPVTVEHAVFQGPVVRCTLRTVDGTQIVAHVGPEHPLPPLQPGLGLRVAWDFDAARLLPPTEASAAATDVDDEADLRHTVERASMARP